MFVFDDYGESWDEPHIYTYAEATEQAYLKGLTGQALSEEDLGPFNLRLYGPASFVANDLFAKVCGWLAPQVNPIDFWHLSYFLFFLIAVVCVYLLCLRWVGRPAAFAAALLFNLQPLLWGHAWMNPKDIPFMAFFLLSIVLGLRAADEQEPGGRSYWAALVLAAVALGAATAIRVIAPAAGLLVAWELAARRGKQVLVSLLVYFAGAALVAYALWPYLWGSPLAHFFDVLGQMSSFPLDIAVLFNGVVYSSLSLPLDYFPRLLALQVTEFSALLMVVGLVIANIRLTRRSLPQPRLFLLVLAWFAVPLAAILIMRPTMYDNFRQFLFTLPPLFVLTALAFEELFRRVRPIAFWGLTLVFVVPGLLTMVGLHTYEYVYYNLFAGDKVSVASRFESDYWVTSYREAIEFLNETTSGEVDVFVFGEGGPGQNIRHFGRPDLYLMQEQPFRARRPAYAVLTTRMNSNESLFPDAPVIYQVERNGMIFVVVKHIR